MASMTFHGMDIPFGSMSGRSMTRLEPLTTAKHSTGIAPHGKAVKPDKDDFKT